MNGTVNEKKHSNRKYIIILILLIVLLISGSYAWLKLTLNGTKKNIIKAGKLELTLNETSNGITIENAVPMTDQSGNNTSGYTFELKNNGSFASDYIIYLDDDVIPDGSTRMDDKFVKYSLTKNGGITSINLLNAIGTNPNRVLDSGTISAGGINTYTLKLWIDSAATNEVMETYLSTKLRIEATQTNANDNILAAYKFVSAKSEVDYCVTGEEATCSEIKCYEPKDANSCDPGDIIKYKVNDTTEKYFHVLHDDGATMTLQQRENTVNNINWNSDGVNTTGPITVLSSIENATNGWSNVNSQTYAMGTTVFEGNQYTGCSSHDNCSSNVYQLESKVAKARIITMQEAARLGCTDIYGSCPMWMSDYLSNCNSNYCTTADDTNTNNIGYWMMSAFLNSTNNVSSWNVSNNASLEYHNVSDSNYGARAVVVINK